VHLVKRVPLGAGLGGGSADAAAVLRWAGWGAEPARLAAAATLGADVPFCLAGGRARVRGIGEQVEPLAFVERCFVLVLPPLAVDTGAAYRALDELGPGARRPDDGGNDLEPAALAVEPELAAWRDAFGELTGRRPRLAGSGSTWFVEGTPAELGLQGRTSLALGGAGDARAPLVAVRTTRAPGV
jgi:4-diphosphocytidyl-2-C-methyl-D-erythritol kinase